MTLSRDDHIIMKLTCPEEYKESVDALFSQIVNGTRRDFEFEGFAEDFTVDQLLNGEVFENGRRFFSLYSIELSEKPYDVNDKSDTNYKTHPFVLHFVCASTTVYYFTRFASKDEMETWVRANREIHELPLGWWSY